MPDDGFVWHALHYLAKGNDKIRIQKLLSHFGWLQRKLNATDLPSVVADFEYLPREHDLRHVQNALRISAAALERSKGQLAGQLVGRLLTERRRCLSSLSSQARTWCGTPSLVPLKPSLHRAGGDLTWSLGCNVDRASKCSLVLTNDGQRAIVMPTNDTLQAWDLIDGRQVLCLDYVWRAAVAIEAKIAISVSVRDHGFSVWNLECGVCIGSVRGLAWPIDAVAISDDGSRAAVSADRVLNIWDIANHDKRGAFRLVHTLQGHSAWVSAVAMDLHHGRALSGDWDGNLILWDIESGHTVRCMCGQPTQIHQIKMTEDCTRAIVIMDSSLRIWNIERGWEMAMLRSPVAPRLAFAIVPGSRIAVLTPDRLELEVWDLGSGERLHSLGYAGQINDLCVTGRSPRAICACGNGQVRLWDLNSYEQLPTRSLSGSAEATAATPDGGRVAAVSDRGLLQVRQFDSRPESVPEEGRIYPKLLCISANGWHAVSVSDDGIILWRSRDGRQMVQVRGRIQAKAVGLCMSTRRGLVIAPGEKQASIELWDFRRGRRLTSTAVSMHASANACVSGCATRVLWYERDGRLRCWDTNGDQRSIELSCDRGLACLGISGNGKYGIAGTFSGVLTVCDLDRGVCCQSIQATSEEDPHRTLQFAAVSGDGRIAVSSLVDRRVQVWDVSSGWDCNKYDKLGSDCDHVAVTDGTKKLLWTIRDDTLMVWDLETGVRAADFTVDSKITAFAVTPNGHTAVVAEDLGRIHFLRLNGL